MLRKTKFIVYVDKGIMQNPDAMADAVIAHMIRKDLDIKERRRFLVEFMRASTNALKLGVVEAWVAVRDVESFPFKERDAARVAGEQGDVDAHQAIGGTVPVDDGADGGAERGVASHGCPAPDGDGDTGDGEGGH